MCIRWHRLPHVTIVGAVTRISFSLALYLCVCVQRHISRLMNISHLHYTEYRKKGRTEFFVFALIHTYKHAQWTNARCDLCHLATLFSFRAHLLKIIKTNISTRWAKTVAKLKSKNSSTVTNQEKEKENKSSDSVIFISETKNESDPYLGDNELTDKIIIHKRIIKFFVRFFTIRLHWKVEKSVCWRWF